MCLCSLGLPANSLSQLCQCMPHCRACKSDLRLLPPLHRRVTRLHFAPEHAQSYNDLVEVRSVSLFFPGACERVLICSSLCPRVDHTIVLPVSVSHTLHQFIYLLTLHFTCITLFWILPRRMFHIAHSCFVPTMFECLFVNLCPQSWMPVAMMLQRMSVNPCVCDACARNA